MCPASLKCLDISSTSQSEYRDCGSSFSMKKSESLEGLRGGEKGVGFSCTGELLDCAAGHEDKDRWKPAKDVRCR